MNFPWLLIVLGLGIDPIGSKAQLEDGGLYCDPNRPASISDCILEAVSNPIDTVNRAALARKISGKLSWRKASVETFKVIERSIVGDQKANM